MKQGGTVDRIDGAPTKACGSGCRRGQAPTAPPPCLMNQLKVSTRLLLLTGTLSLLLIVIGAIGLWGISDANQSLKTVNAQRVARIQ